jgi:ribulose 1,5-bisphosphate synthetase/thiazole synthase
MQNEVVDKKIQVLYDNYRDNLYAKNAQQEVEGLRRRAVQLGAGISTLAFVANEAARLAMRSRKYYLYPSHRR